MILANSNPATIMTDPDFADATYVEPLDAESWPRSSSGSGPTPCCRRSAARRRSTWPWSWSSAGVLERSGVELIGANAEAIATAEDRERFKEAMQGSASNVPPSAIAHTMDEAHGGRRARSACPS